MGCKGSFTTYTWSSWKWEECRKEEPPSTSSKLQIKHPGVCGSRGAIVQGCYQVTVSDDRGRETHDDPVVMVSEMADPEILSHSGNEVKGI